LIEVVAVLLADGQTQGEVSPVVLRQIALPAGSIEIGLKPLSALSYPPSAGGQLGMAPLCECGDLSGSDSLKGVVRSQGPVELGNWWSGCVRG
jgi:hypothetical protein